MTYRRRGSIQERPKGSGVWRIRYVNPEGKREYDPAGPFKGTKREAQARLDALNLRAATGLWVKPSDLTIAGLLEEWLASKDRLPTTERAYRKAITRLVAVCGTWKVQASTKLQHAEAIRKGLEAWTSAESPKSSRPRASLGLSARAAPLAPKTVHSTLSVLSQAYGWALSHELVLVNPFTLPSFQMPKVTRGEVQALEPAQAARLWKACEAGDASEHPGFGQPAGVRMLQFMLLTAERYNTAAGLRNSDVDLEHRQYHRSQMFDMATNKLEPVRSAKNKARTFGLSDLAVAVLKRQQTETAARYTLALEQGWVKPALDIDDFSKYGLVFPSPSGAPMPHSSLTKLLVRMCEQAGVPRVGLHALRRSAASLALYNGASIEEVMQMGAWEDTKMLLAFYARWFPNRAASEAVGRVVSRTSEGVG